MIDELEGRYHDILIEAPTTLGTSEEFLVALQAAVMAYGEDEDADSREVG